MADYFLPLESGRFYHIFNRGNNGDKLFYTPRNYDYFLQQLTRYLMPYLHCYAYCLLPNHFHLLVQVKPGTEMKPDLVVDTPEHLPALVSEQFRRFFLGYATAIKKQEKRSGSLFEKNFKRQLVPDEEYRRYLVNYIHRNPQTHGMVRDYRLYPFSSYGVYVQGRETFLRCAEGLQWFGTLSDFITYHAAHDVLKRS